MKKVFKVVGLDAFDLLKMEKDSFYSFLDQEYKKQFHKDIEIVEADIQLIKDGVKVTIIEFNNEE